MRAERNCCDQRSKTRDFVYIDDVTDAFIAAARLDDKSETLINIGSGVETTINRVLEVAKDVTGKDPQVVYNPRRVGGADRMCADLTIAKNKLGWAPKVSLEEGMRRTFENDENLKR